MLPSDEDDASVEARLLLKKEGLGTPLSFNEVAEHYLCRFTVAQFVQALIASLAWVFDAQQTFISVFTDAAPKWHCTDGSVCFGNTASVCELPAGSWAYDSPAQSSVISEWDLTCANRIISGLPASSFYLGCLVGGIVLSPLADSSLGRKNTLVLSCLLMSTAAVLAALSPNIWIYSILKFVIGFGRSVIGSCSIILYTELMCKRWRNWASSVTCFWFGFGFLSLPAIAYANRRCSWRSLYWYTGVSSSLYCLVVCFISESPRWLFMRGRRDEAMAALKSMAPPGFTAAAELDFGLLQVEDRMKEDLFSAMKLLVRNRWAFTRLATLAIVGIGLGLVYFGMPLAVGELPFDLYLSGAFNASSEFITTLTILFSVEMVGQKNGMFVFMVVSAVCSAGCAFARGWLQLGLEVSAMVGANTAFAVMLIYSILLFPTCVRNSALSVVRQALACGGVLAPVVVAEGRGRGALIYTVFAAVTAVCLLFVACLPQIDGESLYDTMHDAEHKGVGDKSGDLHSAITTTLG